MESVNFCLRCIGCCIHCDNPYILRDAPPSSSKLRHQLNPDHVRSREDPVRIRIFIQKTLELRKIIQKACAYNPNERYQSPSEMYADLKRLLLTTDFDENVQYDVYSERIDGDEVDAEVMVPTFEEGGYDPLAEEFGDEWIAPDLKTEIKIPDWIPMYKRQKEKRKIRKTATYEKLPEIKKRKPVPKKKIESLKELITVALVALVLLILFITCIVMRFSGNEQTLTTLTCMLEENIFNLSLLI